MEREISSYISTLFRAHFGKGPAVVYVAIESAFITLHFRDWLTAIEKSLVKQNEMKHALVTRDIIMSSLESEIIQTIERSTARHVKEFYTDWNFESETGLILGIIHEEVEEQHVKRPSMGDEQALRAHINRAGGKLQKIPDRTDIHWLNDRTILVRRSGILLEIEKEFIRNGFIEELKLSRQLLERRAFKEADLETPLNRSINETFLYWNFDKDLSYAVFRLGQEKC
ncbi:hypothetical protein B0X71_09905 [Planococcus lenghuensis]|uniref:Na+-translocating membrane potential-generating system MpsC domain-containing protein n=2 Tax=Planococcus lenghuensis TaxID=2213202 RepID=A0A1Q2L3N6_9BACL|nr:hypothetical protein B0X71_09905 [Planococcus lenghuensis]